MRAKTRQMMNKMKSVLIDKEYAKAQELAETCGLSKGSIYRMIRRLREDGIGVLPSKKGYVLAEFAKKPDDVHFLRRLNGRRTSDFVALKAAEKYLRRRWRSIEDRQTLTLLVSPLRANLPSLRKGRSVLSEKVRQFSS